MKVLIVSPYRTVAPHFETELEIAQRHLDRGDHVSVVACLGELKGCDFNADADRQACHDCRLRRLHGLQTLDGKVSLRGIEKSQSNESGHPAICRSRAIEELKGYEVDGFDLGYATLSSLVSRTRDPQPDLQQQNAAVTDIADNALRVWQAMNRLLARQRPDRVYVFNGRFATLRAVLRACQRAGVDCFVHERGCDTRHFQLFKNRLPHDIDYVESRMRQHWHAAVNDPQRSPIASDWFRSRIARVEKSWHSFVKGQQHGRLPPGWKVNRHNVVLFTSSDDEFVAIGDCWSNHLYPDQATAVECIGRDLLRSKKSVRLTVRVHPNLKGVDNNSTRKMAAIDLPNVTIIPPEAPIDSYYLMRVADTVATFGSSIGIEAVYWSKPSVLLGPCFYQELDGPLRPNSHHEAMKLLTRQLMPATRHEALIYGYWQNTHGLAFRYFEPDGLFGGTFRDEVIWPKPVRSFSDHLAKHVASIRKRIPGTRRRAA